MATIKAYRLTRKGYRDRLIRLDADGVKERKKAGWKVEPQFKAKASKASSDSDE